MPGGYVVRDANGQALVYVYSRESEPFAHQDGQHLVREAMRQHDRLGGTEWTTREQP
jgi:hypothetical protein